MGNPHPAQPPTPQLSVGVGVARGRAAPPGPPGPPVLLLVLLGISGLFNAGVAVYGAASAHLLVAVGCGAAAAALLALTWVLTTRPVWLLPALTRG